MKPMMPTFDAATFVLARVQSTPTIEETFHDRPARPSSSSASSPRRQVFEGARAPGSCRSQFAVVTDIRASQPCARRPHCSPMSTSPTSSTSRSASSALQTSACTARPPDLPSRPSSPVAAERLPTTTARRPRPGQLDRRSRGRSRASLPSPAPSSPPRTETRRATPRASRAGGVLDRDRLDALVDPLHEPGEDVARPDLDERADAARGRLGRRLRELHRSGGWSTEERHSRGADSRSARSPST